MKKENIELELFNNINDIIRYQELVVQSLPKSLPKDAVLFQKDILSVLKAVSKMNIQNVDLN
ncbi:MAG: hypothetical protein RR346_12150 [Bacteroidales bacterium]